MPDDDNVPENVKAAHNILADYYENLVIAGRKLLCPLCQKTHLELKNRTFNSGMASALLLFYRLSQERPANAWIHLSIKSQPVDTLSKLHKGENEKWPWWGLTEKRETRNDVKGVRGGYWRLTQKGRDFVEGRIRIWRSVVDWLGDPLFAENGLVHSEDTVSFEEALGEHFNIHELFTVPLTEVPELIDLYYAQRKAAILEAKRVGRARKATLRAAKMAAKNRRIYKNNGHLSQQRPAVNHENQTRRLSIRPG